MNEYAVLDGTRHFASGQSSTRRKEKKLPHTRRGSPPAAAARPARAAARGAGASAPSPV